eukprot:jgi/Galph1/1480/GphlegSOOS_G160.1
MGNLCLFKFQKKAYFQQFIHYGRCRTFYLILKRINRLADFILGAADLMLPGVYASEDNLINVQFGQKRSVLVRGNPMPIAVGVSCCSSVDIQKNGMKGKALKLIHYYGDNIWALGDRSKPNDGFSLEQVSVIDNGSTESKDKISEAVSNTKDSVCVIENDLSDRTSAIQLNSGENLTKEPSEEEMDSLLDQCFLQAAKCLVQDSQLPMEASKLFNDFVLPCRPVGTVIDLKKSSYKKLGAFMKSLSKRRLCRLKEGKGQIQVLTINRNHELYQSFEPLMQDTVAQQQAALKTENDGSMTKKQPQVQELWKPHQHMKPLFAFLMEEENKLYSREETIQLLHNYLSKKPELTNAEGMVSLDSYLQDAVFKGKTKGLSEETPTAMKMKELESLFLSRMNPYHVLYKPGEEPVIRKGAVKPVLIIVEDRQGGRKHVTRIQGLETFGLDPEEISQKAQITFACASSVHALPGRQNALEVQCQGNLLGELTKLLEDKFNIPSAYIETQDKRKKK